MKNIEVTLIFLSVDALTAKNYTTVEMNKVDPTRLQILSKVLSGFGIPSSPPLLADIAAKTSGAPLPSASRVTPASDSEIFSLLVMNSSAGDKYSSAVDDRLYMKIRVSTAPIGMNARI